MHVFRLKSEIIECISLKKGQNIGFVPTMGALHAGHISLIEKSVAENDFTVASIFVNPTQFNNPIDLEKYPRTEKQDVEMLNKAGCDAVFIPAITEMYSPEEINGKIVSKTALVNLGLLDKVMEGEKRPGHFSGVMQVVSKLFDIVAPSNAYFGQKDAQQLAVIKTMVNQMGYKINIVACPTLREENGLAMSSRNMRLSVDDHKVAGHISATLFKAKNMWRDSNISVIKQYVNSAIKSNPKFTLEYFEIAHAETLAPVTEKTNPSVACIAVWIGGVRLIDNILL